MGTLFPYTRLRPFPTAGAVTRARSRPSIASVATLALVRKAGDTHYFARFAVVERIGAGFRMSYRRTFARLGCAFERRSCRLPLPILAASVSFAFSEVAISAGRSAFSIEAHATAARRALVGARFTTPARIAASVAALAFPAIVAFTRMPITTVDTCAVAAAVIVICARG